MPESKPVVCRLGAEFVEWLHNDVVARVWPASGTVASGDVRDRNLLESAVNRPFQSVFGEDAYPTITGKAAALFHSLISNHPFSDGNKRTAVLSLETFLVGTGYFVSLSNEDLYALAKVTASYRERAWSHEDCLRHILKALSPKLISLDNLRRIAKRDAELWPLYEAISKWHREVRADPRNSICDA